MADIIKDYLAHSYLYYCLAEPVISDHDFDDLCSEINGNFDAIKSPYKHVLTNSGLPPYKGTELLEDNYPELVKMYAQELLFEKEGNI